MPKLFFATYLLTICFMNFLGTSARAGELRDEFMARGQRTSELSEQRNKAIAYAQAARLAERTARSRVMGPPEEDTPPLGNKRNEPPHLLFQMANGQICSVDLLVYDWKTSGYVSCR